MLNVSDILGPWNRPFTRLARFGITAPIALTAGVVKTIDWDELQVKVGKQFAYVDPVDPAILINERGIYLVTMYCKTDPAVVESTSCTIFSIRSGPTVQTEGGNQNPSSSDLSSCASIVIGRNDALPMKIGGVVVALVDDDELRVQSNFTILKLA